MSDYNYAVLAVDNQHSDRLKWRAATRFWLRIWIIAAVLITIYMTIDWSNRYVTTATSCSGVVVQASHRQEDGYAWGYVCLVK